MQVERKHYQYENYLSITRWNSYYYQMKEVMEHGCKKVLLIGKGDGLVPALLENLGVQVTTFDFAQDLEPDIVGDVRKIDEYVQEKKYDCIMCCQVLEHLEYTYFEEIIKKFSRVLTKDGIVILSLPQRMAKLKFEVWLPGIKLKKLITFPRFWERQFKFNGEHYWEVGTKGYKKKKVLSVCKRYFDILDEYVVFQNPYHWFCILKEKSL